MSHYVKASTTVRDKNLLKKSLTRLGWEFQEGDFTITQYGKSSKAQIKFSEALGLVQEADGTWSMVGDPYHHHGKDNLRKYYRKEKEFATDLGVAYAVEEARDQLENMQFQCIDNEAGKIGDDGLITQIYESHVW